MKTSSAILLLLLQLIFATVTYTQESTFGTGTTSDIAGEEEKVRITENANVLKTSFQIVRPHYNDVTKEKELQIDETSIRRLEKYFAENNDDVFVLGVVGGVHCGKSYLLNELFKDNNRFKIGRGVNPETQGIWLSVYPNNINANGKTVIALDTEGFFSPESNDDYDAKLFAITTLLSSSLVYNTIKNIDQSQVDYLEVLARKTHLFSLKQSSSDNISFPHFYWIIRDFIYNINNNNNKQTKWLNDQLVNRNRGTSLKESYELSEKTNMLSDIFSNVDCLTLPIPGNSKHALQNLGSTHNVDPAWTSALEDVRKKILVNGNGRVSNGLEFLKTMRALVRSIQEVNKFPEVPSVWEALLSAQNSTAVKEAEDVFDLIMNKRLNVSNPLNKEEFEALYNEITTFSINVLKKYLFDVKSLYSHCIDQLDGILRAKREILIKRNNDNLDEFCKSTKSSIYSKISQDILNIPLPMLLNKLNERMEEAERYSSMHKFDKFNDICKKHVENLNEEVRTLKKGRIEVNSQKITQKLSNIVSNSVYTYTTKLDEEIKKSFTEGNADTFISSELTKIDKKLSDEVLELFVSNANEYSTETEYTTMLGSIRSKLETHKIEKIEEIKKSIKKSINAVFDDVYTHFRKYSDEFSTELPFTERELETKFGEIKTKCDNEIRSRLKWTTNSDEYYSEMYTSAKNKFTEKVEGYWNRFIKVENVGQYDAHIAEPFRLALNDVKRDCVNLGAKQRFEACAREFARRRLEHTFPQSKELTEKAIEDFLNKEEVRVLAPKDGDYVILITVIVGAALIFLIYLFLNKAK